MGRSNAPAPRAPWRTLRVAVPLVLAAAGSGAKPPALAPADAVFPLETTTVVARSGTGRTAYEGVVEAVRQTVVAAQVAGAVAALHVKAGDRVQAGQVLLRIDARAADQTAVAGAAQASAARAALDVARQDVERQQQLFAQGFISQAALDRAQAHFKSSQAQASAQGALALAATAQSGFHVVKAPYDGVVAAVSVVQGDMAMPGRPMLTLYDPGALRVSAAIPQTGAATKIASPQAIEVEIPGVTAAPLQPTRVQLLPTVDAASHTAELRLELPARTGAAPGMFARAWLPSGAGDARLFVPAGALVRRAEFAAVYVVGSDARPSLRPVRPGRSDGDRIEILTGVAAGDRVALDPQAAARLR